MRVLILTDMEGIAGVDSISDLEEGTAAYERSCQLLCHSINLATKACFACGAETVYYLDGHGSGHNADPNCVDPHAVRCSVDEWQELIRSGAIDCQIHLGSHARAGTDGGFLDHTISSRKNFSIRHNGQEMSELALQAVFCAKYSVPIVADIGDLASCRQAKEYIPNLFTGAVKQALCRNRAITDPNADRILTDTVTAALQHYKSVSLINYREPLVVEQVFCRTDFCEQALQKQNGEVRRMDARTLQKTVTCITSYPSRRNQVRSSSRQSRRMPAGIRASEPRASPEPASP